MKNYLRRGALLAVMLVSTIAAPVAHAGLSDWTSLAGLSANSPGGPQWVRLYATGTPPTTIYAGTEGNGVFKSVNDGITWAPFNDGLDEPGNSVYAIYTSGGMVYAGTDSGLFSAPDTVGSGGSWTPVAQGTDPDPAHPTKLNQAVQAVISVTGGPMLAGTVSQGVFKSTDDGKTWTPPADDNGMPASTTVWSFASFANFVWAATSDGIYRSSDQGSTWSLSSDGIPFTVTLGVFQDTQNPLIYYAETGSDGIYRSIDGGTTWQSVNGDPDGEQFGGGSTPIVRAIQEFSGATQTRLYTATSDGLWVGTLPNVTVSGPAGSSHALEVPGTISWRPVTQAGLGNNSIFWALSSFTTIPGTLLAGTQSNGGYSLTFQPPTNDGASQDLPSWLAASILQLQVGTALIGTPGNWSGTPQIDYSYQWQRCTSTQSGSCSDISGATDHDYTLVAADQGKYIREVVTATNDFPLPSQVATAKSVIAGPVGAEPGPLPGDNQSSAPSIIDDPPGDTALPTEGDTLDAPSSSEDPSGYLFNPAASNVGYQWLLCDVNGDNCAPIAGATSQTYQLIAADDGLALRVQVTGYNDNGGKTLPISGATNPIIALPAQATSPPTLTGNALVGSTLVGGIGTWASPATYWARQWEQCQPDGSDCAPIQGATSPEYTVQTADYGMKLRMHVIASVVPPNHLPLPVDAYTPISAVVTYPVGVTPPPPPKPNPKPTLKPPALSLVGITHHGHTASLNFNLSGPGSATITLERVFQGHRKHRRCVVGKANKRNLRCTLYTNEWTVKLTAQKASKLSTTLPMKIHGHKLPVGQYRIVIVPADTAGARGKPVTFGLTLRRS